MSCIQQEMNRYNQIVKMYLFLAQQIDYCAIEDREFYQDVCLLFAEKMKTMRLELAEQGLVLCQRNSHSSLCENNK